MIPAIPRDRGPRVPCVRGAPNARISPISSVVPPMTMIGTYTASSDACARQTRDGHRLRPIENATAATPAPIRRRHGGGRAHHDFSSST
ncbi:hypothetical protein WI26_16405 [Burkholderia diffusa]|nr:hypothetical protein WI26_16405 [Burkholderia diffusa]